MRTLLALLVGSFIYNLSRLLKIGGGSAAPGYYALKIEPNLLSKLIRSIPINVVITGTNGKTTTSKMLAHILEDQGLRVIRNSTGSNLERGIVSTLIAHNSYYISQSPDIAIWEVDEAAFTKVVPVIRPNLIMFLNIFRDQLDRYGEIHSVVKKWTSTLKQMGKWTHLLINGDDTNLDALKTALHKGQVTTFGIAGHHIEGEKQVDKNLKKPDLQATEVDLKGLAGTYFHLLDTDFFIPIPGIYHLYDATAAIIATKLLQQSFSAARKTLADYSPAFGRFERFDQGYIFLIKNPTGATEVLKTIQSEIKPQDRLLIALNDNFADGTDVSWIWDSQFELLSQLVIPAKAGIQNASRSRNKSGMTITVSGTRAYDLALRLKYAGIPENQITIEPELKTALDLSLKGLPEDGRLFILPTYTALLDLQNIMVKMGLKRHYWREN